MHLSRPFLLKFKSFEALLLNQSVLLQRDINFQHLKSSLKEFRSNLSYFLCFAQQFRGNKFRDASASKPSSQSLDSIAHFLFSFLFESKRLLGFQQKQVEGICVYFQLPEFVYNTKLIRKDVVELQRLYFWKLKVKKFDNFKFHVSNFCF